MQTTYNGLELPQDGKAIDYKDGQFEVPDHPIIPFIEGDGTGRDIWKASQRVFDAAVEKAYGGKRAIKWFEIFAGEKAFRQFSTWLPDDSVAAARDLRVSIKGPLTTPVGGGIRSLNVALRQLLDLYACVRPVKYYQGVPSPVKHPENVDIVIFRENTEDVYSGIEFKQGSADGSASSSVKPLHWVSIKQPFAMSTSAVTVDQFRAFITATGRDMQGCDAYDGRWKHQDKNSWQSPGFEQNGTHPVTCASWRDATAYAQWLSAQTGHHYRLPSASEWEYAARGGSEAVQPWSANGSDACANANVADLSATRRFPGWMAFNCNDGYVFTAPVGSFKANAFGLNDMLGNVFQWTEDCWNATYKGAPIDGSARTDGNCNEHELRGGSWFSSPGYVRADYRNHFAANYRASSAGIRLARDITP